MTEQSQPNATGGYDAMVDPSADYNRDFNTIDNATVALDIRFETQDSDVADKFVTDNQQRKMVKSPKTADVVAGFAIYSIDLTTPVAAK
jgi:2',3'-cyclic-nucleotide 2'-phosphodiesterase/3'-nucleotidase